MKHEPSEPHNAQSLYYGVTFSGMVGRSPTWADAMAHCAEPVRQARERELRRTGTGASRRTARDPSSIMGSNTDHRIIHRFIPPSPKHGAKTACGIKLVAFMDDRIAVADDGGQVATSNKGKPFDCKRCRVVLERRHMQETA